MDIAIIITISVISFLAVFSAIVFDGRIKKKPKEKDLGFWQEFREEFGLLKPFAWIIILIAFMLNGFNVLLSIENINDNQEATNREKAKNKSDSTYQSNLLLSSYENNNELKEKKRIDSIEISDLKRKLKELGYKSDVINLKSDLINKSVVENAVKALDEQRQAIERERENIFKNLQVEVANNLLTIFKKYEKKHILGFIDTTLFISTRMEFTYLNKYYNFSQNTYCISELKSTEKSITTANKYADDIIASGPHNKTQKGLLIRMFLNNVEGAKENLLTIFWQIKGLKSYKEFEVLKSYDVPPTELEKLENEIQKGNI